MNTQHGPISFNVAVQVVGPTSEPKVVSKTWKVDQGHLQSSWTAVAFKMARSFSGLPLHLEGRMISVQAVPYCFEHMDAALQPVQCVLTTNDLLDEAAGLNLPVAEALAYYITQGVQNAIDQMVMEEFEEFATEAEEDAKEGAELVTKLSLEKATLTSILKAMGVHAEVDASIIHLDGNGHNHNGHDAGQEEEIPDWIRFMMNEPKSKPSDDIPDWLRDLK